MTVRLYRNNGYHAFDCPRCAMEVKVERHGQRVSYSDRGGCGFDFTRFNGSILAQLSCNKEKEEDEDEGYVQDSNPYVPSPSPTPNCIEEDEPHVEWLLRTHDAGEIQPRPVELPPLPSTAWASERTVMEFYRRVWGLRELMPTLSGKPVMFGCEWVGGHVGLSAPQVSRALNRLVAAGVLKLADGDLKPREGEEAKRKGKRPVNFYLPGGGL